MNPWYLSDSQAVSPSRPLILHINSVLTTTTVPSHPPPPPPPLWQKLATALLAAAWGLQLLPAHFSAVSAGGRLFLFCFFLHKKRVKPHNMSKVMGRGCGSRLTESLHVFKGFLEGGFISTSSGSWWVSSPVPFLASSMCVCCNGVAGPVQVIARLPVMHSQPPALPDLGTGR